MTTKNITDLNFSTKDLESMREAATALGQGVADGLRGRKRVAVHTFSFEESLLKEASVQTLREAAQTLRREAIAKMTWSEYSLQIAREYGPAVAATVAATLGTQYAISKYNQRRLGLEMAEAVVDAEGLHLAM